MAETKIPLADLKKVVYNGSEATTVNFGVCTWTKPYTLTLPALPAGVASCTVSRSSTKSSIGTTGTIATAGSTAKTVTVYHGDVISISATAATGYNNPSATLSQTTVSGNITATITAGSKKSYTLSYPAKPTGVASYVITRNGSTLVNSPTSAGTATIYYGDTLAISATAATGYNAPTYKLSATTVTGNVTATVTKGSVKSFTLTKSSLPTGVASHTVTRTSSPLAGASTGALSNGATIYYGDVLTQTATAASGYNAPSVNWSTLTVDGNETATATAGSVATQWRTILSTAQTIYATESGATLSVSGLRANTKTRISFSGSMASTYYENESGDWTYATHTISAKTNAESSNGVYTGSNSPTYGGGTFGYTLTMQNGSVKFVPYINTWAWNSCAEQVSLDLENASLTITKIEQYY